MNVHFEVSSSIHLISHPSSCLVRPQCFSLNDTAKTPSGNDIRIGNPKIGEKVLAIDRRDQIIPTEIIAILHYETNAEGKYIPIKPIESSICFFSLSF